MEHLDAADSGPPVRLVEVVHAEGHLGTGGRLPVFGLVESEVDEGAVGPRRRRVTSARPPVVSVVIGRWRLSPNPSW